MANFLYLILHRNNNPSTCKFGTVLRTYAEDRLTSGTDIGVSAASPTVVYHVLPRRMYNILASTSIKPPIKIRRPA